MKHRVFTAELTDIDLNYIDASLNQQVREYEAIIEGFGKDHGNISALLRQVKRTRQKLLRVHYPPNGKPKLTPRIRRILFKMKARSSHEQA